MTRAAILLRSQEEWAGFTLLEMLLVLAIMALIAAVSIPVVERPHDRLILEAAARRMEAALRLTRARAIGSDRPLDFFIDVEHKTYGSRVLGQETLPAGASVKIVFAKSMRRDETTGAIRFFPDGESSGGDIILRLHGLATHIAVNWLTGEATTE